MKTHILTCFILFALFSTCPAAENATVASALNLTSTASQSKENSSQITTSTEKAASNIASPPPIEVTTSVSVNSLSSSPSSKPESGNQSNVSTEPSLSSTVASVVSKSPTSENPVSPSILNSTNVSSTTASVDPALPNKGLYEGL